MLDFLKLRPSAPTAAAMAEALERARSAQSDASQRAEAARATRDRLLLDGDAAQLTSAEAALAAVRDDVERAGAIVVQLGARHAAATRTEMIGKADAATQAVDAANADLKRWWEKNEAGLRRILSEGHRLSVGLDNAYSEQGRLRLFAQQAYPDATFIDAVQGPRDHRDWPETIARLIQHGVSKPHQPMVINAGDDQPDRPMTSTEPGSLVQGIPASRNGGTLASIYIGQPARDTEDAA